MAAPVNRGSEAYQFWKSELNCPQFVVAPMVDQSDLAWRMLSREYGAQLCYVQMLHAARFCRDARYRKEFLASCPEDRPLIVQFCANDPEVFLEAAKLAESFCDAIDLNLGCPQIIAKRGKYGAFLQDDWDLVYKLVSTVSKGISKPVTCKIRSFEDVEKTVRYAKMLESAGCQLLTVHGRTREQKGANTGLASWEHIRAVKQSLSIPVLANGNIQFLQDVFRCLEETGVDGVMSAEGSLHNPAIFVGMQPFCWEMADRYLELVGKYPAPLSSVRGHLFKIWHHVLQRPEHYETRVTFGVAKSVAELTAASATLRDTLLKVLPKEELLKEYAIESIPYWRCQPYIRPASRQVVAKHDKMEENSGEAPPKKIKGPKKKKKPKDFREKEKWPECVTCKVNRRGLKCEHSLCKTCCRREGRQTLQHCASHRVNMDRLEKELNTCTV